MHLSMSDMKVIQARCAKAYADPWETERDNFIKDEWIDETLLVVRDAAGEHIAYVLPVEDDDSSGTASFIAHARVDVEKLLDEVVRLRALFQHNGLGRVLEASEKLTISALQAILTRFHKARLGPWKFKKSDRIGNEPVPPICRIVWAGRADLVYVHPSGPDHGNADAAFITNARSDVPRLLEEISRLEAQLMTHNVNPALPSSGLNGTMTLAGM
jgi:hypothetical protein